MNSRVRRPRYNHRIPNMRARTSSGRWLGWLASSLLATILLAHPLPASTLEDAARQLAHKVAAASGPGSFALEITNRSSLNEKSIRDISGALESQLQLENVHPVKTQGTGNITVTLSESLRDYVWTAEIVIGANPAKRVALIALPRPIGANFVPALPIAVKSILIFTQENPILDFAVTEMPGGPRLLMLEAGAVALYRRPAANPAGPWEPESALPVPHSRAFPRDLRGRLVRRDHLFEVYLPGEFCRFNLGPPATLTCNDGDDPWPLASEEAAPRAFFAASRNFFTGVLSPGIGKISNVPSFYSAAALPRSNYTLWVLATLDGSLHLIDGTTDQAIGGNRWGSDLAAVHSSCGVGTQVLVSGTGDAERDNLRAFEIPDHDPVLLSAPLDFNGQIVALWPDASGAAAIVRRQDTGWYEAYRIYVSCGS